MTFATVILLSVKAGRSKLPNFEILKYQDPKRIASWWRWWLRFPEANIWTPSLIWEILTTAVNDSASIDTRPEILETSNFEYLLAVRGCWQLMPLTRTNLLENWKQNGRKWDFESIWCRGCLDVDNGMFKGSHGLVDDKWDDEFVNFFSRGICRGCSSELGLRSKSSQMMQPGSEHLSRWQQLLVKRIIISRLKTKIPTWVALIFNWCWNNSEQPVAVSVIISQNGNFICEEDFGEIARETMLIKLQRWHHLDLFRRTLYWQLRLFLYVLYWLSEQWVCPLQWGQLSNCSHYSKGLRDL